MEHGVAGRAWAERVRSRNMSTPSLLEAMERRTQKTYRYGIALVCVGATFNWFGFVQGHGYVDPLRYLGVACVVTGSFCVCMAMCRWLGRPIAVSSSFLPFRAGQMGHRDSMNTSIPMYHISASHSPSKPPDYDTLVPSQPPPYEEAVKLIPSNQEKPNPCPTHSICVQSTTPPPPYVTTETEI